MSEVINDVSDTSFWVAHYRGIEGDRPDALFKDPWAARMAGDKGRQIAESMPNSEHTGWHVVIRTRIIDAFIEQAVAQGADTLLCLGAGLDARPYRLALPKSFQWIEVDYPHVIGFKEEKLAGDVPTCQLTRVPLDLADRDKRRALFEDVARKGSKVIVLTEGVVPYLSAAQAAELADDLRAQPNFAGWIVDYISPLSMKYIRQRHAKRLQHAPFRFDPEPDWITFFAQHKWVLDAMRYLPEAGAELGRNMPLPWIVHLLRWLPGAKRRRAEFRKSGGYGLLIPG